MPDSFKISTLTAERTRKQERSDFISFLSKYYYTPYYYEDLEEAYSNLYFYPHKLGYDFFDAYCKMLKSYKSKKVIIEYVNDSSFQAFAAYSNSGCGNYISISAGVPTLLQAVYHQVITVKNPFATTHGGFDDVSLGEVRFPIDVFQFVDDSLSFKQAFQKLIHETLPNEKWQRVMSTIMAEISLAFIVSHELSHIFLGHTYLNSKCGNNLLNEVRYKNRNKSVGKWVSQAWEIEADQMAVSFLYNYMFVDESRQKRFKKHLKCKNGETGLIQLLSRVVYALSITFFIFSQTQRNVKSTDSHPSALVRVVYIISQLMTVFFHHHPKIDENKVERSLQLAHEQAESAWNQLGFEFGYKSYKETIDDLNLSVNQLERAKRRIARFAENAAWK